MRPVLVVLLVLLSLYLLLIAAAWAWQERLVWQPPPPDHQAVTGARRITYEADDGQPLYAYLVGDPARAPGLLLSFHGNAELAAWSVPWAAEVARRTGWAVMVPEYRGYGGLPGAPTFDGARRDALAAHRQARTELGVDSPRIVFHGHSLGSAYAAWLAREHPPAALILLAPFTSVRDMARAMRVLPLDAMWGAIGRVDFDTRAVVASLDVPVSVAHGERDVVVPVHMGRSVHASARRRGALLLVPGAGHNDLMMVAEADYWAWLERALADAASEAAAPAPR